MAALLFLIPAALALAGAALVAFLWSVKSGQYEDIAGASLRALSDDDLAASGLPSRNPADLS